MGKKYVVAFDQGTTSSRAVLFNHNGKIEDIQQKEFTQHFPSPGWVEHDPMEILRSQTEVFKKLLKKKKIKPSEISAIGITNQRETTVVWDRRTGKPVCNAIVWQDRRTATICDKLKAAGLGKYVKSRTGLVIDAYFSGPKIKWILDNIRGAREKARKGYLLFGTIDTWLIWNLTNGHVHATDYSNASRTMLFDINKLKWDPRLMKLMGIPKSMLPEVRDSSGSFGEFLFKGTKIPIAGVAGDQQAALFGQNCFSRGMAKNTYGTGCFVLMNSGNKPFFSKSGLVTTIGWGINGRVTYALEGSIFIAGAVIQWLRDGIKIIASASESEKMAVKAGDAENVFVVPAFVGLGAPYWDMYARGTILGLTRDTGREHIVKAALESLAYQTIDVIRAMEKDSGIKLRTLRVDGGACANNFLMKFQSDILGSKVERPAVIESSALGAASLAGLSTGFWNTKQLEKHREVERKFSPSMNIKKRKFLISRWHKAVERSRDWLDS